MIVVDANVVMPFVREDALTGAARSVHAADPDWVMPPLWQSEVLNALLNEVRAGYVTFNGAMQAVVMADELLGARVRDCRPEDILATAHRSGLTAYDATYVTLARSLDLPLITEDKQILRACPDVARSMRQFLLPPEPPKAVRERPGAYGKPRTGKRGHT